MSEIDEEVINQTCGKWLGYKPCEEGSLHLWWLIPGGHPHKKEDWKLLPDFLNDANTRYELLAQVKAEGCSVEFVRQLAELYAPTGLTFNLMAAPQAYVIEAALRAVGRWRDEWE